MAIYHLSAREPISRSSGKSATAAAAYRSCDRIVDQRTGQIFDYRNKRGLLHEALLLPGGQLAKRSEFWNGVEKHHRRGDAQLAREMIAALPAELPVMEMVDLATKFCDELLERYGVAVDLCIHSPSGSGDDRNFHAHILHSACAVNVNGELGKKFKRLTRYGPSATNRQ
jgi:hypothetical protein